MMTFWIAAALIAAFLLTVVGIVTWIEGGPQFDGIRDRALNGEDR